MSESVSNAREEAARRFPYGPVHTLNDYQTDIFRDVFVAGAVWASSREPEPHDAGTHVSGREDE